MTQDRYSQLGETFYVLESALENFKTTDRFTVNIASVEHLS